MQSHFLMWCLSLSCIYPNILLVYYKYYISLILLMWNIQYMFKIWLEEIISNQHDQTRHTVKKLTQNIPWTPMPMDYLSLEWAEINSLTTYIFTPCILCTCKSFFEIHHTVKEMCLQDRQTWCFLYTDTPTFCLWVYN